MSESELRTFLKAGESNISVTLSLSEPTSSSLKGDVDGDEKVSISDLSTLINILLGKES